MSMSMTKIKRIFENFTNSKTDKLIIATERTLGINPILTIHAMVPGESFPKKFQFDKSCINAALINSEEALWVVIEEVAKKKAEGEGYWKNNWIRIIGTAVECSKYIEKNGIIKDICGSDDDWAAQFGGTVKVYDQNKTTTTTSKNNNTDNGLAGGEDEVEEQYDTPE